MDDSILTQAFMLGIPVFRKISAITIDCRCALSKSSARGFVSCARNALLLPATQICSFLFICLPDTSYEEVSPAPPPPCAHFDYGRYSRRGSRLLPVDTTATVSEQQHEFNSKQYGASAYNGRKPDFGEQRGFSPSAADTAKLLVACRKILSEIR